MSPPTSSAHHSGSSPGSTPPLRPVPLQELRLLAEARAWQIEQPIAGLPTLTPVRGALRALHHGTVLEVEGQLNTIVTLCCDRCLGHFNHPLEAAVRELIELRPTATSPATSPAAGPNKASPRSPVDAARASAPERPAARRHHGGRGAAEPPAGPEGLEEQLDPLGRFDPEQWVFEQLSLQLPLVNRCGADCPGPATWSSDPEAVDLRWAALGALREP